MKYLVLSASIAVFIYIVQADHTFKANYTLTKIPETYSNKPESKTFDQQKERIANSLVTTVIRSTKTTGKPRTQKPNHRKQKLFNKTSFKRPNYIKKTRQSARHNKLRNNSAVTWVSGWVPNLRASKHVKQGKKVTLLPSGSIVEMSKPTKKLVKRKHTLSFRHKLNKSNLRDSKRPKNAKREKHPNKPLKEKLPTKSNQSKDARQQRGKISKPADHHNSPRLVNDNSSETKHSVGGCWAAMEGDVAQLFRAMNVLNEKYQKAREDFTKETGGPLFDKEMYEVMIWNRSVSERALFNAAGVDAAVPAGLQLGGHAVLEDGDSLLNIYRGRPPVGRYSKSIAVFMVDTATYRFFHRLKLRNKTSFSLHPIKNDLMSTLLHAELNLGDLHLTGNYERLKICRIHPGNLYYAPTYGGLDFLLRDVKFKMEGRYKVANGRLLVEQVVSNITGKDALMVYTEMPELSDAGPNAIVKFNQLDDFVDRLKIDLNHWVKDYFNDYLTYFGLAGKRANTNYQSYDREKTMMQNNFVDHVVRLIRWKLHAITDHIEQRNSDNSSRLYMLPNFTITTLNGMKLKCSKGMVHGLSSIYRRSTATGPSYATNALWRKVDAVVGFSALKVVYLYKATTAEGPPMDGQLVLTANDLTAHMAIDLYANDPAIRLHFDEIHPMKVQTLTIEGPVNQMIGSFRHVLENHIVALLVNALVDQVKQLDNVFKCPGYEHKALEPPPKMKPLVDVGPNEQGNHSEPEVDYNEPDVQNEDEDDDDSEEEPGLAVGSSHVESDKDVESQKDPRLSAENGHHEPNEKDGDSNDDEHSTPGAHIVESNVKDTESPGDSRLPEDDYHKPNINDKGSKGAAGEDPSSGNAHFEPNAPDDDSNGNSRPSENDIDGHEHKITKETSDTNNGPPPSKVVSVTPGMILEKSDSIELKLPKDEELNKERQMHVEVKEQIKILERKEKEHQRRYVGRQEIAKKGGKKSRSELLLFRKE